MSDVCNGLPHWAHPIIFASLFVWEFYMGKRVHGSTIGFIIDILKGKQNGR